MSTLGTYIHERFEQQAALTPDAPAIVCGDTTWTYHELNARSNQLARLLRETGVRRERLVGLCVDRSPQMVAGVLGILKAGGAFVPLDPSYPKDRLTFMLDDSRVSVMVTEQHLLDGLRIPATTVVCLDADDRSIGRYGIENLSSDVSPSAAAYAIYTSGTTGQPRGVVVTHGNVSQYVRAIGAALGITADNRYLHTASIAFSSSVRQLTVPLCHGATLVIATSSERAEPLVLLQAIKRQEVTVIDLVPSHWRACIRVLRKLPSDMRAELLDNKLRLILSASEPLQSDLPRMWRFTFNHPARLLNMFGLTETTGIVTVYPISVTPDETEVTVPIGRPIDGMQTYILDEHLRPVHRGSVGELFIGGEQIARGYLNHPELTAEKFIPNPFSNEPASRLYRTGDQARSLPDGNLEFLGRRDQQVKVRGHRVELAEVESALRRLSGVEEAVVLAGEDPEGGCRLVGFVVPRVDAVLTTNQLRSFLTSTLPGYMVPSLFVFLEELPLTPNGKIDRRALQVLTRPTEGSPARAPKPPGNPTEQQLVEIWERLLKVRPIGVQDDFFELGGYSLLAAQMMSEVEETFGRRLPLSILYGAATIEHLRATLVQQQREFAPARLVKIQGGSKPPFFYLHGDRPGGGFYCLRLARLLGADRPFYAVSPHGIDGEAVPSTVEAMAAENIARLREVHPEGPYLLGGHCNGGVLAFEMARMLVAEGARVEALILIDASPSPNLRVLRYLIDSLSHVLRVAPRNQLYLFERWRDRLAWLNSVRHSDVKTIAKLVLGKARVAGGRFRRALRSAVLADERPSSGATGDAMTAGEAARKAMAWYVPRSYPGAITILRTDEWAADHPNDPTIGWAGVATEVNVLRTPGAHLSAITTHVDVLASHIRSCLDGVPASDHLVRGWK